MSLNVMSSDNRLKNKVIRLYVGSYKRSTVRRLGGSLDEEIEVDR